MDGINGLLYKRKGYNVLELLEQMNRKVNQISLDVPVTFLSHHENFSLGMNKSLLTDNNTFNPQINDIVIDFNGVIYNRKTLKSILLKDEINIIKITNSELIKLLYQRFGVGSFEMLDGMYTFSIYDKRLKKLFIVRDFFGEKPIYYYKINGNLVWASELNSIISILDRKPDINKKALNLYFQLTYIPAPYTIYEDIYKLEPDHYIVYDLNNDSFNIKPIIRTNNVEYKDLSDKNLIRGLVHDKVTQSVISRSIGGSVGTFLSGGVDSSIVSLCLSKHSPQKIDTFSLGFKKKSFDETDKSRLVSKIINSNHHEFIIRENDLYQDLSKILLNFAEPYADSSALPSYLIAKYTKEKVNIALTGDGGDEVFGGYNKYYMGRLNQIYTRIMPQFAHNYINKIGDFILNTKDDNRGFRFKLRRLINSINYQNEFYYGIISLGFTESELSNIFNQNYFFTNPLSLYKSIIPNPKTIHDFRALDRILSLEGDLLVKVDRTSRLNSLECRSPFLNRDLWEFANKIPENYLINGWNKKYILKEAFKEYFPKGFLDKSKQGFEVPVGDWLRSVLRKELEAYIERKFLVNQGIFNVGSIQKIVSEHLSGAVDNTFRVWTFYCFQKWYTHNYEH